MNLFYKMYNILTATELLNLAFLNQQKWIAAALLLNFNGKATHFITAQEDLIFDEGVDGELVEWKKENFIKHYKNSNWLITQIV